MSTLIVYADTSDGYITSASGDTTNGPNGSYSVARGGTGFLYAEYVQPFFEVGQSLETDSYSQYGVYESFLSFDTSSIGSSATVSSATLNLRAWEDDSTTDFTIEARLRDWGASLTEADFVAGASLSGCTLLASKTTSSGWVSSTAYNLTSETAFASNVNKTGSTRLLLCSDRTTNNNAPSDWVYEFVLAYSADNSGTTYDPKLTITYEASSFTWDGPGITLDAWFSKNQTGSFSAAAVIKATITPVGGFAANAILKATISSGKTFTADAIRKATMPPASVTVITIQDGGPSQNEIQQITVVATGGTWTLTLPIGGVPVPDLAWDISAADLDYAMETWMDQTPWVTVTKVGSVYTVEFDDQPNTNLAQMTADGSNLVGGAAVSLDAVKLSTVTPAGGFKADAVIKAGSGTKTFPVDAVKLQTFSPTGLLADAVRLATITGVIPPAATGFTLDYEWLNIGVVTGSFAADAVLFANSGTKTTTANAIQKRTMPGVASVVVATTRQGGSGVDEQQTVTVWGNGGTFSLEFEGTDPQDQTTPLPWNVTAAAMKAALEATDHIENGDLTVTLTDNVYTVTFGGHMTGENVAQMVPFFSGLWWGYQWSANAIIRRTFEPTFAANAVIKATVSPTGWKADAAIKRTMLPTGWTADAIRKSTEGSSKPADAVIRRSWTPTPFTADAVVLSHRSPAGWTADAIRKATITGAISPAPTGFWVDYQWRSATTTIPGDFKADAYLAWWFTANAWIVGSGTVWTAPPDGSPISYPTTLTFLMPDIGKDMHFNIQIDKVPTFDGSFFQEFKSNLDVTGWEYWNGGSWAAVPTGGVPAIYAGYEARYTIQTPLSIGTWYRRVRAG